MVFLSQLLKKPIYYNNKQIGKLYDFGIPVNDKTTKISNVVVRQKRKKVAYPTTDIEFGENRIILRNESGLHDPQYEKNLYLSEDLLDKQVIDITGKKLVRVNDVAIKINGDLQVQGIDIGMSGVLRRLGINFLKLKTLTLPWSAIEAFDYETGDVRIKLSQSNLNTLHPADLADILEEAGTKEREGIVEILDATRAAEAIEEANSETQEAIFEQLETAQLKKILEKMPLSEIADVIDDVNPATFKKIIQLLGTEKASHVEKLMFFPDDVAGGLMQLSFYKESRDKTIEETIKDLPKINLQSETIIVVDSDDTLVGQVLVSELVNAEKEKPLESLILMPYFVSPNTGFAVILQMFSRYNLRLLPVKDESNKVMGVITIDAVLRRIEEEEEKDVTI